MGEDYGINGKPVTGFFLDDPDLSMKEGVQGLFGGTAGLSICGYKPYTSSSGTILLMTRPVRAFG